MSTETAVLSAEQIAAELRWRLSNSNAELDEYDVAYDAWEDDRDGATFTLAVSFHNLETGRRGTQQFTVTVAAAPVSDTTKDST